MIAIIDYGAGNVASVKNVIEQLGYDIKVTKKEVDLCKADKIIFPGVGEAAYAVKKLHFTNLFNFLRIIKKPLLGICLGMQLLYDKSEEGNVSCLGIVDENVKKFESKELVVPHMGWSKVNITKECILFKDIPDNTFFYFAHSFYAPISEETVAKSIYGNEFSSAIQKDNYYGVQFHPEKSGEYGIKVIKNFLELA